MDGLRRLVLVPCPFQGHITPMFQLGSILHSKGFSITIAHTQFNFPDPSNYPGFSFLSLFDGISEHAAISSLNFIEAISGFSTNCNLPFKQLLVQMMEEKEIDGHGNVACVIYDSFMCFAGEVANQLKLPSFILRTSSAAYTLAFQAIHMLQKKGHFSLQDADSAKLDTVSELHPLRFKDLPVSNFHNLEALMELLAKEDEVRSCSAIVWNTGDFLEGATLTRIQQHYRVPFFPIGPFHKMATITSSGLPEDDSSCMSWLDKQADNSVLYVSFGSIVPMDETKLAEMAWGLATCKQPFLWVIKPKTTGGYKCIESLPEGFIEAIGERGCIVKWAPQRKVLAHRAVGGFWSHCGWNSTIESISEGVPLICDPCFGDQKVHARYIGQVWRVGIEWEDEIERSKVERAVRRLMVDNEGHELRQRAMKFKEQAELSTQRGGSSYNCLVNLVDYMLSL